MSLMLFTLKLKVKYRKFNITVFQEIINGLRYLLIIKLLLSCSHLKNQDYHYDIE